MRQVSWLYAHLTPQRDGIPGTNRWGYCFGGVYGTGRNSLYSVFMGPPNVYRCFVASHWRAK